MSMRLSERDMSPFIAAYVQDTVCVNRGTSVIAHQKNWECPVGSLVYKSQPLVDSIYVACMAPDNKRVLYGTGTGSIRVWDVVAGRNVGEQMIGHTRKLSCLTISDDGEYAVSGSLDKTVRSWRIASGDRVGHVMEGHSSAVNCVAVSRDNKYIASGSKDKTVRIWDLQLGHPVGNPMEGHSDLVRCLSFSADGRHIVSGSRDHSIRVWNVHNGSPVGDPITSHTNWVSDVTVSPDGTFFVSGSLDKTARVCDMESLKQVGAPVIFKEPVYRNFIRSDCSTVVSGCHDGTVRIWRVDSRQIISEFSFKFTLISDATSFSRDGSFIVAEDNKKLFIRTLEHTNEKDVPFFPFEVTQFSTNRSASAVAANFGSFIYVWTETENSAKQRDHMMRAKHRFNGFSISPCGKLLVISDFNWLEVWSIKSEASRIGTSKTQGKIEESRSRWGLERPKRNSLSLLTRERVPGSQDINVVDFDELGRILLKMADSTKKAYRLKKMVRTARWRLKEIKDFTTITAGAVSFSTGNIHYQEYIKGKNNEEIKTIPPWMLHCTGRELYDIFNKRVLATFPADVLSHCWADAAEKRKQLIVLLQGGRILFVDVYLR